jgi:hypothetical protein
MAKENDDRLRAVRRLLGASDAFRRLDEGINDVRKTALAPGERNPYAFVDAVRRCETTGIATPELRKLVSTLVDAAPLADLPQIDGFLSGSFVGKGTAVPEHAAELRSILRSADPFSLAETMKDAWEGRRASPHSTIIALVAAIDRFIPAKPHPQDFRTLENEARLEIRLAFVRQKIGIDAAFEVLIRDGGLSGHELADLLAKDESDETTDRTRRIAKAQLRNALRTGYAAETLRSFREKARIDGGLDVRAIDDMQYAERLLRRSVIGLRLFDAETLAALRRISFPRIELDSIPFREIDDAFLTILSAGFERRPETKAVPIRTILTAADAERITDEMIALVPPDEIVATVTEAARALGLSSHERAAILSEPPILGPFSPLN